MAIEQFQKAIDEMLVMDKDKENALYYLGVAYEHMGENEKALNCFKEIYQQNVNFRDVKEKIENFYANNSEE